MFEEQQRRYDEEQQVVHLARHRRQTVTDKFEAWEELKRKRDLASNGNQRPPSIIPKGWEIAEVNGVPQNVIVDPAFDVSKLMPHSFLVDYDDFNVIEEIIGGVELCRRAVWMGGNLGLAHGEIMIAQQHKMHPTFRKFFIPLPGTVLITAVSENVVPEEPYKYAKDLRDIVIPFLCYDGRTGLWGIDFNYLHYDWDDSCRFAV